MQYKSFENTVGKGGIAHYEHFPLSRSVFHPFGELSAIFIKLKIVVCKFFQFRRVKNFLLGNFWKSHDCIYEHNIPKYLKDLKFEQ